MGEFLVNLVYVFAFFFGIVSATVALIGMRR